MFIYEQMDSFDAPFSDPAAACAKFDEKRQRLEKRTQKEKKRSSSPAD